jgi:hypothetical protein
LTERVAIAVICVDCVPAYRDLLIMVDGLQYSTDFTAVYSHPLVLSDHPNRLVYCPHDYSWSQSTFSSYDELHTYLGDQWGFILTQV